MVQTLPASNSMTSIQEEAGTTIPDQNQNYYSSAAQINSITIIK